MYVWFGSGRSVRPRHPDPVLVACILQTHPSDETPKCDATLPVAVQSVTNINIGQILADDHVTLIFNGFCDDLGSDGVEVLYCFRHASSRFASRAEARRCERPAFPVVVVVGAFHHAVSQIHVTTPVIVPITIPESSGGGDNEAVHTEVDTEDCYCLVPGIGRNLCVFVSLVLAIILPRGDMDVELVGCCVGLQCACTELNILSSDSTYSSSS